MSDDGYRHLGGRTAAARPTPNYGDRIEPEYTENGRAVFITPSGVRYEIPLLYKGEKFSGVWVASGYLKPWVCRLSDEEAKSVQDQFRTRVHPLDDPFVLDLSFRLLWKLLLRLLRTKIYLARRRYRQRASCCR